MTRIVLMLTAVPLAAVLALLLDTLLDRRLTAIAAPARRPRVPEPRRARALWLALALAPSIAVAPALARTSDETAPSACASIDCSLMVDASLVDRLWKPATDDGAVLVAQSRIPVAFDAGLDRWDAESDELATEDRDPGLVATAAPPTTQR